MVTRHVGVCNSKKKKLSKSYQNHLIIIQAFFKHLLVDRLERNVLIILCFHQRLSRCQDWCHHYLDLPQAQTQVQLAFAA